MLRHCEVSTLPEEVCKIAVTFHVSAGFGSHVGRYMAECHAPDGLDSVSQLMNAKERLELEVCERRQLEAQDHCSMTISAMFAG